MSTLFMQISEYPSDHPLYPESLHLLEGRRPASIFALGPLPTSDDTLVAIVGTRRMTSYGEDITYRLAYDLAKAGVVIVSGLAAGIDSVAHRAALEAGGRTIAVLGGALDHIYPPAHRGLAQAILAHGGSLLSEYAVGTQTRRWFFAERNRLIAALSQVVIITESPASGGSLLTANRALQIGRTVMAVPGDITAARSAGPNQLIKSGAVPVLSVTDVFQELNLHAPEAMPVPAASREEALLMDLIRQGHATHDALIQASGLNAAQVANHVSLMEITGKVRNLGAGIWAIR
jgi:DNA processing protein